MRSDTVTRPTPAMRRAMFEADVGDDVFGEDPTITKLEETAAACTGKEAALFVSSGTMANLVSLLTHTSAGDELLVGDRAHIVRAEAGGVSRLGGVLATTLPNQPDGGFDPELIPGAVRPDDMHQPRTTLLALENTHNFCGGSVVSLERTEEIAGVAREHGLRVHLDGARIFNAAVASGHSVAELAGPADSVAFCLSKGLGAPVGSLICGDEAFIREARRTRKLVGGGMRQAGILAAAGLVALDQMVDRLADDHANARQLARGLAELGFGINPEDVQTNIVIVQLVTSHSPAPSPKLNPSLKELCILVTTPDRTKIRLVTHADLSSDECAEALLRMAEAEIGPAS
ncbi:MAG: low-specificity L-threonine aldolase [Chloroflexi bacterium]|nr:low-specificity L-threonine aldolase [Chloroflexota bacterium]